MAKLHDLGTIELGDLRDYIWSDKNEDAKRPLLYPIFKKLFRDKFRIESDAHGSDVYIEGALVVEAKTDFSQWLEGFYQALHYKKKYGLSYNTIIVIAHEFIAIWKLHKLPEYATIISHQSDPIQPPNIIGKLNAKKTSKANAKDIRDAAQYWLDPKMLNDDSDNARNLTVESFQILKILKNLESDRIQINNRNFIDAIKRMMPFFEHAIDAVHAFYTIIPYWQITSTLTERENGTVSVTGFHGNKASHDIAIRKRDISDFRKFIETQYIFTNEGSGITADYYFSRFDEVMAEIDPEYVKQHGIFFTDSNLSKFALWFAKHHFPGNINDDYIVFDPAGGSGNLVSSWRGKIKHKIISELQPDLLRTIERRLEADPYHVDTGFTIVPKTSEGKGLNFLDRSGAEYLEQLKTEVGHKNIKLDKPIAFLLNPPYKNTDENVKEREKVEAHYEIHPSIMELTGEDAGKERYLAFLGQILNISREYVRQNPALQPVVMIFTPTSWLLPRPTYAAFRKVWDTYFEYDMGFIIAAKEFFSVNGNWPLAFTIWKYRTEPSEEAVNHIKALDLTTLKRSTLANINWNFDDAMLDQQIDLLTSSHKRVVLDNSRGDIKENFPTILNAKSELIPQTRLNIYRNRTKEELDRPIISGFPLKDERHERINTPYGYADGAYIGFMDDNTPVRLHRDVLNRLSNNADRVWFYLDNRMIQINLVKVFSSTPDKYGYCAYNLDTAKFFCEWFSVAKSIVGKNPLWSNQFDMWQTNIPEEKEAFWYSHCFAYVLAENRCVVTKFEKDNPVPGAPEVFVDNPLAPNNSDSFWSKTLQPYINSAGDTKRAGLLIEAVTELYLYWNRNYTKGQYMTNVGLHNEPYFKYFDYEDFLTPHSGLIQIKKFAELRGESELLQRFDRISVLTKEVREALHDMLVKEFRYFD